MINLKCLFGKHDYIKIGKSAYNYYEYQKGAREKLVFFGTLYRCRVCRREKFVNIGKIRVNLRKKGDF